jgi:hypothetical protein
MNRPILVIAFAVAGSLCLSLGSSAAENDYATMGLGSASCGKFAEIFRLGPSRAEEEFFDWAQGFMSGLNMALLMNKPPGISKN